MDILSLKSHIEPSLENDKLGIKKQHDSTLELICAITGSATIAVSAQYGSGKTFFAKCLENTLKKDYQDSINTIYIDLWSNDYKNPLTTFISALDDLKNNDIKKLKKVATQVLQMLSFGINLCTQIPTQTTEKVFNYLINGKDKEDINSLKDELKKLAKNKKLVVLVDEIDRCRPEYAIETLETIKHFFEIDNIIFILFINQSYICNIENQYTTKYGIGTHGYIEKFIDKTIMLNILAENYMQLLPVYYTESSSDSMIKNQFGVHRNVIYEKNDIQTLIEFFSLSARSIIQISNNIKLCFKLYPHFSLPPPDSKVYLDRFNKRITYRGIFYLFLMYALKLKNEESFKEITINQNPKYLLEIMNSLKNIIKTESEDFDKKKNHIDTTINLLQIFITGLINPKAGIFTDNVPNLVYSLINIEKDKNYNDVEKYLKEWLVALNN